MLCLILPSCLPPQRGGRESKGPPQPEIYFRHYFFWKIIGLKICQISLRAPLPPPSVVGVPLPPLVGQLRRNLIFAVNALSRIIEKLIWKIISNLEPGPR